MKLNHNSVNNINISRNLYTEKNEVNKSDDQCLKSRTHSKINRGINLHDVPFLDD